VALLDYDDGQHLTALLKDISPDGVVTNRLWLDEGSGLAEADVVLIDSAPARSHETRRALVEADYVLVPAPPERQVVRSLQAVCISSRNAALIGHFLSYSVGTTPRT